MKPSPWLGWRSELEDDADASASAAEGAAAALTWPLEVLLADAQTWHEELLKEPGERCTWHCAGAPFVAYAPQTG